MGLKSLVRADLKLRGLSWDKKAPQATQNPRDAKRLAARQRGYHSNVTSTKNEEAFTMPGSYRK